jgi:hypothetical protein
MKPITKTILYVSIFAVAMGFLESAVVIYLRQLYYKDGFSFPLKPIEHSIAKVEFFREIATIIMLIGIGYVTGKTKLQRFAYFNLAFAIWDIFYYVFLYVFLGWPQSLQTWDILFLVPLPWVGPVWAPCLLSVLMIIGSVFIIKQVDKDQHFKIKSLYWIFLIGGALICILSFMWDYIQFTSNKNTWSILSTESLFSEVSEYIPQSFNSILFFLGFSFMCYSVFSNIINTLKSNKL